MTVLSEALVKVSSILFIVFLSACSGGGQSEEQGSDSPRKASVAVSRSALAANDPECPNGGIQIDTGIDENLNGVLDVEEVDKTEKVCHGTDGSNALINMTLESPGINCASGGVLFESGADLNGDQVLSANEITQSEYACNGPITDIDPDAPISNGQVSYVKLVTNRFTPSIQVGDAAELSVGLELELSGYDSDDPLFVNITDSRGYFTKSIHQVTDSSSGLILELVSTIFAEANSVSTELKVEFCNVVSCLDKAYGDRTIYVDIEVEPRFNSATLGTDSINQDVLVGQYNLISLDIDFDTEGYNYFNPLYISVNDGGNYIRTEIYTLRSVPDQLSFEFRTNTFYDLGENTSTLSVEFCNDYNCTDSIQEPIEIPLHLIVRNPIVSTSPSAPSLAISQTILETSSLNYELNILSDDDVTTSFWVNVYDPEGAYFDDVTVGSAYLSQGSVTIPLEINAFDGTETETRSFQIKSRVCKDRLCGTVLSSESGSSDVSLNVLYPSATVTINEGTASLQGKDGLPRATGITGTWTANDIGNLSAYVVAIDDVGGTLVNSSRLLPSQGSFDLSMEILPQRQLGTYSGNVSFKVCLEPSCEHEIGNSSSTLSVELDVNELAGWTTHQRNATHNGYIPLSLDVNNFAEAWTWGARPNGINPVVAKDGKVIVTDDVYHGDASVFMLDEATGDEIWRTDLEDVPALNPPAITDGKVWAATTGSSDTFLHAFDFETGHKLHSSEFNGQWPHYYAPTPYGDSIYQGGGYYGGYVHSFSALDGEEEWEIGLGGGWDMYTPAISGSYALHYNGQDLHAIHRDTGELKFTLGDTLNVSASHAYHGAPVVFGKYVVAYAGGAFSGRASSNVEHYDERYLVVFDIKNQLHLWNSSQPYLTHPAISDGVLYAGSDSRGSLDALDLETGDILWTWEPADVSETEIHRNTIVTNNLLFVSTNEKVHAIDLSTKASVWNYPLPGMIAISENGTLFIATGASSSDGKLIAIQLQ